jgi:serine/threonine protein kinase
VTLFRNNILPLPFELISALHVKGEHRCQTVDQDLASVKRLKEIHDNGFVHGDIRGMNIVFTENGQAEFIDFDFGGHYGVAKYPPGYICELRDGNRDSSAEEKFSLIEPEHDVTALAYVLGFLHTVTRDDNDSNVTKPAGSHANGPAMDAEAAEAILNVANAAAYRLQKSQSLVDI